MPRPADFANAKSAPSSDELKALGDKRKAIRPAEMWVALYARHPLPLRQVGAMLARDHPAPPFRYAQTRLRQFISASPVAALEAQAESVDRCLSALRRLLDL